MRCLTVRASVLSWCCYVQPTAVWAVKAGDKKRGRKRKEEGGSEGRKGSDGVTDTETYRRWRRQEVTVEAYGCRVCQACEV